MTLIGLLIAASPPGSAPHEANPVAPEKYH